MILKSQLPILISGLLFAFALSTMATGLLLPLLRRLKAGQSIREEGPAAHMAKAGTPTMGGIAFVTAFAAASVIMAVVLICKGSNFVYLPDMIMIALVTIAYAVIGFIDDYIKVVKKRNLGLTEIQKLALQILVALLVAVYVGNFSEMKTVIYIPFFRIYCDFGFWFYPFVVFVMVAMTNGVNLTDGLDGLAASVTAIVSFALSVSVLILGIGCLTGSLASACLCGCCLGFLVYNRHPAKVFMGDTGSLALGGALTAIAITAGMEFLLPFAGLIFVLEALSVIIQVFVFKTQNGRRFFRMAPLHHHFELGGMTEVKVVIFFSCVSVIMGLVVILLA